jgi:hypothetical protein
MIDFQSSLTELTEPPSLNQRHPAGISSPGGPNERSECYFVCCSNSNERSECRFVCCSGVDTGEGELHRGRQSALIEVRPCPSGTFENSQQHARVIYGWVRSPINPKFRSDGRNPPRHINSSALRSRLSFPLGLCEKQFVLIRAIRVKNSEAKKPKSQNEPNFRCKSLPLKKKYRKLFQFYDEQNSSPITTGARQQFSIQSFPSLFKAIKGYPHLFKGFWKKIIYFAWRPWCHDSQNPETGIPSGSAYSDLLGPIPAPPSPTLAARPFCHSVQNRSGARCGLKHKLTPCRPKADRSRPKNEINC